MKLSKKAVYAISAIHYLNNKEGISSIEIAKNYGFSANFTALILTELKNSKLIISKRGPGGGYKLNKNFNDILLYDILKAIKEPLFTSEAMPRECKTINKSIKEYMTKLFDQPLCTFNK